MRPTRAALALAGAIAGLAGFPGPGEARHPASPACPPAGAELLAADLEATVYQTLPPFPRRIGQPEPPTVIGGCTRGARKRYRLGDAPECVGGGVAQGCGGVENMTLAGPLVAYEAFDVGVPFEGPSEGDWYVVVRDLRSGRVLHKLPTGKSEAPAVHDVGTGPVNAIVLESHSGDVAWTNINEQKSHHSVGYYEVHAFDKTGARLLAAGTDVDPSSLALGGSRVYWTQAGQPAAATLR